MADTTKTQLLRAMADLQRSQPLLYKNFVVAFGRLTEDKLMEHVNNGDPSRLAVSQGAAQLAVSLYKDLQTANDTITKAERTPR